MGLILFILIGIVAEILIWVLVGDLVGSGWYVFFWFIVAFFIGLNMLRSSTSHILPQMQQMQMSGQMSADPQVSKYMTRAIAGFLLMLPGLISDVVAVLMLIPAVQRVFRTAAMNAMQKRQQAMMDKMMGGMMGGGATGGPNHPFAEMMRQMQDMQRSQMGSRDASNDPTIIDGEAREIQPEQKRIESKDKE